MGKLRINELWGEVVEVTHNDILENKSARGTGKVGSSGK